MASTSLTSDFLASIDGALPSTSEASFRTERELGNTAYREGRYADAIRHYTQAETINPLSPLPPANRAMVYLKRCEWQKAREEASIALELHDALPTHLHSNDLVIKLHLRRATACTELALYALAVDDYSRVLRVDRTHAVASERLEYLRKTYRIDIPTSTGARAGAGSHSSASRIIESELLNGHHEKDKENNQSSSPMIKIVSNPTNAGNNSSSSTFSTSTSATVRRQRQRYQQHERSPHVQDDTPLLSLPEDVSAQLLQDAEREVPRSAGQFDHTWRTLQSDAAAQGRYLVRTVGVHGIRSGVIGPCFTPDMLQRFGHVLSQQDCNASTLAGVMMAIAEIERFDLVIMFLSAHEKAPFIGLLQRIKDGNVDSSIVEKLHSLYK